MRRGDQTLFQLHSTMTQQTCAIVRLTSIVCRTRSASVHILAWLALVLFGVWGPRTIQAAESGELVFPDLEADSVMPNGTPQRNLTRPLKGGNEPGAGLDARIGFIGLPTLGREDSIVPLELFPYVMTDNTILFGDIRGFLSTRGRVGANIGLGYRFIEPNDVALFGVNGFYDVDATTGKTFHQLGFGWEARMEMFGTFGNVYLPVGKRHQTLSQSVYNERFSENRILFDVASRTGQSMAGLDLNIQSYLPGDFARDHQIQAIAGWYTFNGDGVDDINGFHLQLQGDVIPSVRLLASYTNDKTFGSNIAVGGMFRFGTRERPDTTLNGQLRRFIHRNYNVIVSTKNVNEVGLEAINPETGNAYVVRHVGSAGTTPNGDFDNPFDNVDDAQNAGADIIYVHEGTTLTDGIVLQDGQSLIGEGATVQFQDSRYGSFYVPGRDTTGTSSRPIIDGAPGNSIIMADRSLVAGFMIKNADENAILVDGVDRFKISDIVIESATGDGIRINDSSNGTVSDIKVNGAVNAIHITDFNDTNLVFSNLILDDLSENGVLIDGGYGTINFKGPLVVRDADEAAFQVRNQEKLVVVDDKGTPSTADDVTTETRGVVLVEQLVVRNTTGGEGILLTDNEGGTAFGSVDIQTANASAVVAENTEAFRIFNGYLSSTNAAAIDVEDTGMDVRLTQMKVDGGTYGARFVDTTGSFMVYGTGNMGSGGEIKNTNTAIYMENGPTVGFQTVNFTANQKVAVVDGGESLILVGANIAQTADTIIDANNLKVLQVSQSQFTNNTISSGNGILFKADEKGTYTASVTFNDVNALPGTFFRTQMLAGAEGSTLTYNFQGNDVELSAANSAAAAISWTGPILGYFQNNVVSGTGMGQTGFQLYTGASGDQTQFLITQNSFTFAGANAIGVDVDTRATSTILTTSNLITFNGLGGTGVKMNLRKASGANVSGNKIVDNAGGATGIHFESAEHLSTLVVNGNLIDLLGPSAHLDRGIVLGNVLNSGSVADPFVTFVSTQSNTINGANVLYTLPATGAKGTLLINNTSVQ